MVYMTGYVGNSHQLAQIIHASMRDAGWTLISGMNSSGIDSVLYSDGEDGYQDIYIRVAAGLFDRQTHGDIQFPSNDGYTAYVNFFAYQHFPNGASDPSYGTGEVGRYGPILHILDDNKKFDEYNFFKSDAEEARGWTVREQTYESAGVCNLTDGHRYIYDGLSGKSNMVRFDYGSYPMIYSSVSSNQFNNDSQPLASCFSRKSSTEPFIWNLTTGTYATWNTYNIYTGEKVVWPNGPSYYPQPPWGTSSSNDNWAFQGIRRNGQKHIYINRGAGTTTWARYDIDTNEWTTLSPSLPFSADYGSHAILIPKEVTDYEYDRIYITRNHGYSNFRSIAVDDDGNLVGSWVAHDDTLVTQGDGDKLFYMGGNKIFYLNSNTNDVDSWTFPANSTDSGTWVNETYPFNITLSGVKPAIWVRDHLASRVGVDEFKSTQYWIFADKDRIIVLTNTEQSSSLDKQEFAYAGLFYSYKNTTPINLTSAVMAGQSTLDVSDVSGFKIGATYKIAEINQGTLVTICTGEEIRVGAAETFIVQSVKQSTSQIIITEGLSNSYSSVAKISEDIQPIGVSLDSLDRIHVINTSYALDKNIGKDRPWQYYYLQHPQLSTNTVSERNIGSLMWPIMLRHDAIYDSDDSTQITHSDVRGNLIGVYLVSSGNTGDILEKNGQNYLRFSVDYSNKLNNIAVGPME
jgi:hypothetical protein